MDGVCTASALSVGSQWRQSSYPAPERLFDEQAAKSGAVDEQVARHLRAVFHHERCHVPARAVLLDARDLAFDAPDALGLELCAQVPGVETGIEVVGVVERQALGDARTCPASAAWCSTQ